MKKALAQNPNLLRTLIGLSVTLIFMLSYAVYGATVSPSVYIYQTEATVDQYNASEADQDVVRTYDEESNTTCQIYAISMTQANLQTTLQNQRARHDSGNMRFCSKNNQTIKIRILKRRATLNRKPRHRY